MDVELTDAEIEDCYQLAKAECGFGKDEKVDDRYVALAARCSKHLADKMCEKAGLKLVKGE